MCKKNFEEYLLHNSKKAAIAAVIVFLAIVIAVLCLTSCNVTRTVTTSAEHYQRGDTTVTIMTKTVESYDGAIKRDNFLK